MSISRAIAVAVLLGSALSADAATFVVTNTSQSGPGSLRQAITDANLTADADLINFNIVTVGAVKTIGGTLPEITQPLTIDGYSQAGATKNTRTDAATNADLRIQLDASAVGIGGAMLKITNGPASIRGLAIKGIPAKGIGIEAGGGTRPPASAAASSAPTSPAPWTRATASEFSFAALPRSADPASATATSSPATTGPAPS